MRNLVGADDWSQVPVPDDGNDVTADAAAAGNGPQNQGEQGTLNRVTRLGYHFSRGGMLQRPYLRSVDGVLMVVGVYERVVFDDGLAYSSFGETALNVHSTPLTGWGYVYLRNTGALEASADPPDDARILKLGDPTRRYIGCYRNESGVTVPCSAENGVYAYAGVMATGGGGAPAAYTAVDLSGFVPPHARMVRLWLKQATNNAGPRELHVRPSGVDFTPAVERILTANRAAGGEDAVATLEMLIPLGPDKQIEYKVSGTGTGNASIYVAGWVE